MKIRKAAYGIGNINPPDSYQSMMQQLPPARQKVTEDVVELSSDALDKAKLHPSAPVTAAERNDLLQRFITE